MFQSQFAAKATVLTLVSLAAGLVDAFPPPRHVRTAAIDKLAINMISH